MNESIDVFGRIHIENLSYQQVGHRI